MTIKKNTINSLLEQKTNLTTDIAHIWAKIYNNNMFYKNNMWTKAKVNTRKLYELLLETERSLVNVKMWLAASNLGIKHNEIPKDSQVCRIYNLDSAKRILGYLTSNKLDHKEEVIYDEDLKKDIKKKAQIDETFINKERKRLTTIIKSVEKKISEFNSQIFE